MKKTAKSICFIVEFVTCLTLAISCQKENPGNVVLKEKLTGIVQKGPFMEASIILYELNSSLVQTGRSFSSWITGNGGSYKIGSMLLSSPYVELKANGYYFNEVSGDISSYHLSLKAISDIKELSEVNVNLLTHLENERVKYLVGNGAIFTQAKDTAQKEILSIFGFSFQGMDKSEKLDISVNKDENAILLAISVILQGDRSVRDLTELLSAISSDIREDGTLDDTSIIQELRNSSQSLDLEKIRTNLVKRYMDFDISALIPDFEKYVNLFLSHTGAPPSAETLAATDISGDCTVLNGTVKANDLSTSVSFEYGTSSSYGNTSIAEPAVVTGHNYNSVSAEITGLTPSTTYHFRIKSVNSLSTVYGNDLTFTTVGGTPEVITAEATDVTVEGATINGMVNANDLTTTVTFEYGTTESYGSSIPAEIGQLTGHSNNNVKAVLSGLDPRTDYHFRIKAVNVLGTAYSSNHIFKTLGDLPNVISSVANYLWGTGAVLQGIVNANGLTTVVTFEYGESVSYGNTIPAKQGTLDDFKNNYISANIRGLIPETSYHFRINAVNSLGTIYGDDITFTTPPEALSVLYDIEGNYYPAVFIGNQVWMAENLRTTKFNDNTPIPNVTVNSQWTNLNSPAYCWYNNNETSYKQVYGALYNGFVQDTIRNGRKNVCPLGWHTPSIDEWRDMIRYIGGELSAGKLREVGTSHWEPPNSDATNETGFTGLPGGYRYEYGTFSFIGGSAFFLTSSLGSSSNDNYFYRIELGQAGGGYVVVNFGQKQAGASIRCIMDTPVNKP
jgi:uncharacterized protein (TIGR02145 family)